MTKSRIYLALATFSVAFTLLFGSLLNARDQQIDPRTKTCYQQRDDCGRGCDNAYGTGPGHQPCAEQCYKAWMECCNKAVGNASRPPIHLPTGPLEHVPNAGTSTAKSTPKSAPSPSATAAAKRSATATPTPKGKSKPKQYC